ncbi:MAG: hypothetical protein V1750_05130, partial [Acidobacteriota bacterium]
AAALAHPGGKGRALWARQLATPESGVFWVEEEALLARVAGAAEVAAANAESPVVVVAGPLEDTDVARLQARAAAAGHESVVLTSLPLSGVAALPLAGGEEAVWALAATWLAARSHASKAAEAGRFRPALAREVLEAGAASGFTQPPRAAEVARGSETASRTRLVSPAARQVLAWLEAAPLGLTAAELVAVAGEARQGAVEELERLRLVERRRETWRALTPAGGGVPETVALLAQQLPVDSWAGAVARALAGGGERALRARCEQALEGAEAGAVLAAARAFPETTELAEAHAEAALALGRLAEAQRALDQVAAPERGASWHALAAWWAELAGLPGRAEEELRAIDGEKLPARLAARTALVAAELARRQGERGAEARHLEEAVTLAGDRVPEARLAAAMSGGRVALRALWREGAPNWTPDIRARALHLVGLEAYARSSWYAAATAFRAALRQASGENLLLLGDIHSDLGGVAILTEKVATAERHLLLAERWLEAAGSRRAVTVVRANRGVLAADRLQWRRARELILASRELRGGVEDSAYWFEELELARSELARGEADAVRGMLPRMAEAIAGSARHLLLEQALAAIRAHLALIEGDVGAAGEAAATAEDGERELIMAVVAAARGEEVARHLPERWGLKVTAELLGSWRRGEPEEARRLAAQALATLPAEGAVGFARFAAILARGGEALPAGWVELAGAAEEALDAGELDGWAARLRDCRGIDPARLVRALDGVISAGSDALGERRLAELGRALGL